MDAQLAAIYGTGNYEPEQSDIEKMAAAELLMKLAEEQGVDLDQFSDQEISEMVSSLYKSAEETPAEEKKEKESQFGEEHEKKETKEEEKKEEEKVAEADFLGRVMAHSMVHELREIEKEAGVGDKAKGAVEAVGSFLKGRPGAYGRAAEHLKAVGKSGYTAKARLHQLRQAAKAVAPELGAAGGLTAAAIAAKKMHGKKKESAANDSALEQLAQQAAFAMAKEAGYIDEEGNLLVQREKQASALEEAVYARALQICEENGLPVEWNK